MLQEQPKARKGKLAKKKHKINKRILTKETTYMAYK